MSKNQMPVKARMKPVEYLICSCCGDSTRGRQWHNRDAGYGICPRCAEWISSKYSADEFYSCYGKKGVHFSIEDDGKNQ